MEQWVIAFYGKTFRPELVGESIKQNTPTLFFQMKDKKFSVDFENRSDYYAAAYHTQVRVKVWNPKRTVYYEGIAVNVKLD